MNDTMRLLPRAVHFPLQKLFYLFHKSYHKGSVDRVNGVGANVKNTAQMTQKQKRLPKAVAFGLCSFFFGFFPQGEGDHQVKIESSTKQSAVPPYSSAMLFDAFYAVAVLLGILLGCDDSAVPQRRRCGV